MKTRRHIFILLLVALVLTSIVPALQVAAQDSKVTKLCLVTDLGRVNDGTFNQFAHEGAKKAADEFGLDYTFIETQAQTDYAKNIQTCLDEGYDTIVTVGFLIAEATNAAAVANPKVHFIGVDQFVGPAADGTAAPTNYAGLQFREDQAGFLAGAIAAQMSKSGTIAGVYGIDIPPVHKYRVGFEQGAKFINPNIKTLGTYIPSFTDPAAGGTAAEQFLGEGADVIFGAGGPTGSGGIIEAAKKGALVIGVDQDEFVSTFGNGSAEGAKNVISSAMKRVDQAVYLAVKTLVDGGKDFPAGTNMILSASNDGVGFAAKHDADVPDAVTNKLSEILIGLKNGWLQTGVDAASGELLNVPISVADAQAAIDAAKANADQLNTQLQAAQASLTAAQADAEAAKSNTNSSTLIIAIIIAGVIIGAGAFLGMRQRKPSA